MINEIANIVIISTGKAFMLMYIHILILNNQISKESNISLIFLLLLISIYCTANIYMLKKIIQKRLY